MTTRRNPESEILHPLPDPEALIRKSNADKRRTKELHDLQRAALLNIAAITPLPTDISPIDSTTQSPHRTMMAAAGSSLNEPLSAQDLLMRLMVVQETSIKLAQADQEAAAC
jgi:hypothetical protein